MQICWRKKIAFKDDETTTVTADKILIASGTTPRIPEIEGLKESRFITSDEALRLRQQPRIITFIWRWIHNLRISSFLWQPWN